MKRLLILAMMILGTSATMFAQGGNMPWKKQIALDIGPQLPSGDGSFGLGTAIGVSGTFYYQLLTRNTFVSASIGTHNFPIENSNESFSIIPLLIGMRYNFALTGIQPYIGAEFGAYLTSVGSTSETELGVMPKVGLRFPLSPGFDIDASIKHNIVLSESSFSFTGINLGIAYTID